jgi:hypothetical protein
MDDRINAVINIATRAADANILTSSKGTVSKSRSQPGVNTIEDLQARSEQNQYAPEFFPMQQQGRQEKLQPIQRAKWGGRRAGMRHAAVYRPMRFEGKWLRTARTQTGLSFACQ